MNIDQLAERFNKLKSEGRDTSSALNAVVLKSNPYIKKIIYKMDTPDGVEYSQQDLEQTAKYNVVKALRNYDSSLDSKFSTYMYLRVRGGLISYLRKHDTLTRTQRDHAGEVSKAVHDLSQRLGREPSAKEIAYEIEKKPSDVRRYIRQLNSRKSEETLDDITLESQGRVDQLFNQTELRGTLKQKLKKLDVRSRVILLLVYYHDLTTKQIGKVLYIHRNYVSTLKHRALRKLRKK